MQKTRSDPHGFTGNIISTQIRTTVRHLPALTFSTAGIMLISVDCQQSGPNRVLPKVTCGVAAGPQLPGVASQRDGLACSRNFPQFFLGELGIKPRSGRRWWGRESVASALCCCHRAPETSQRLGIRGTHLARAVKLHRPMAEAEG